MSDPFEHERRSWPARFGDAFIGVWQGIRGQRSFVVHFVFTLLVIAAAIVLRVSLAEACLLTLCVTIVLSAEMFNSAIERLARAIDENYNEHLKIGLNIASAAVLIAAVGAVLVGACVFLFRLGVLLQWWQADAFVA